MTHLVTKEKCICTHLREKHGTTSISLPFCRTVGCRCMKFICPGKEHVKYSLKNAHAGRMFLVPVNKLTEWERWRSLSINYDEGWRDIPEWAIEVCEFPWKG